MSGINSINQAQGFNQQAYDNLIKEAITAKVDTGLVDQLLLEAISKGKSFDQAIALVGSDLPKLSTPTGAAMARLGDWVAIPSPGALIMSVTTQFAAQQRQQNQELMWQETEAISQSMKDQASEMRTAAVTQLVLGIAGGVVQIGVGLAQMGMGAYAMKSAAGAGAKASANATAGLESGTPGFQQAGAQAYSQAYSASMMHSNITIGAVGQLAQGAGGMISAGSQYVGTQMQASIKEKDADQEKMRAVRDSVKNLDEALRDLIRKALAAQNDIAASTNQARTKILA
jgi:hypothetical protein